METILIVEDEQSIREFLSIFLQTNGYHTITAKNGVEALDIIENTAISLLMVDIMMPEMDGYELTKTLRQADFQLPIIMVTAKETGKDMKEGFLSGTDDYITKPIDEEILLLRIRALLRRSKIVMDNQIKIGEVIIDADSLTITKNNQVISLPNKEFFLLFKLLSYPNKIFTRIQLMDEIWGYDTETDPKTVNVHINRLREHLVDITEFSIETVRGLGYKAVKQHEKTQE